MKKLENTPFSLWEGELSSDICNAIINEGLTQTIEQGTIENDGTIDENMRKGKIAWLAQDGWVDNLLFNYVSKANVLNDWFFQLTYREKPQFTIYEKEEHYDWHRDCNVDHPLQRKLSVTVQLSDPASYEGGDLHIRDYWNEKEIFHSVFRAWNSFDGDARFRPGRPVALALDRLCVRCAWCDRREFVL